MVDARYEPRREASPFLGLRIPGIRRIGIAETISRRRGSGTGRDVRWEVNAVRWCIRRHRARGDREPTAFTAIVKGGGAE